MSMKGITCCADCAYYNTKKHRCTRAVDEGKPTDHFYADCPLPTVTNAQGWISADKRPPKQGRYLVWGLTRVIPDHNDEQNGYWQTKIAQWFEGSGWDCKVKFWQMLPEPPKEDEE